MEQDAKVKRKGGRPRTASPETRNPVVGFRVRSPLLAMLKGEAATTGLSVSEVIEGRLTASYGRDAMAGDARTRALGDALTTTLVLEEARVGKPWFESDNHARFSLARIIAMLRTLMGVPDVSDLSDDEEKSIARLMDILGQHTDQRYSKNEGGLRLPVYVEIRKLAAVWNLRHRVENASGLIEEEKWRDRLALLDTSEDE